ncbi:MAG: Uma2 family endonuclease [Acidobacteriota bacterium]|nr:Uma2 family endonuclease [Acidobacteriota bacterium]
MAAARDFLSLERFEQLYSGKKPNYEYWFGEAIQKSMPTSLHGFLQLAVAMVLKQHGWKAGPEIRLKMSKVANPVPDVVASMTRLENPYPTSQVDLCVEILSKGDKVREMFRKGAHYIHWGIATVWIIDRGKRKAYLMSAEHPAPLQIELSGKLTAGTGKQIVTVSLADLLAQAENELA